VIERRIGRSMLMLSRAQGSSRVAERSECCELRGGLVMVCVWDLGARCTYYVGDVCEEELGAIDVGCVVETNEREVAFWSDVDCSLLCC